MNSSRALPAALLGILLATAGCGSSSGDDQGNGSVDASLDTGNISPVAEAGQPDTSITPPESDAAVEASPVGDDDDGSTPASVCGDGKITTGEECDDGNKNGTTGDPCTSSCTWVCIAGDATRGNTACDDGNPCDGTETCLATHACAPGTPASNGTSCGTGKLCNSGLCTDAVCGDAIVTAPEECDDGSKNGSTTDGCTKACKFVCLSTDTTRNCTPADACQGKGTCNDTTHICAPGTQEGNGTICSGVGDAGTIDVCKGGTCVAGYCGDGVIEGTEQCDFGAANAAGAGCELNCTFSCTKTPSDSCVTTDLCGGTNTCTSVTVSGHAGQQCKLGTPPTTGTTCPGGTCQGGICQTATCGNGVVDANEQCDFGSGKNLAGSGCEPNCKFSCQTGPDTCANDDLCAVSPTTCQKITAANSDVGQKCQAATQTAACGDCGSTTTGVCVSNKCATSTCGDGCVDSRSGETCEPPGTATCDASCHTIAAAVCGNGKLETGETCDDSNKTNLDGCNSTCQFEQIQRATAVAILNTTDATFCPNNALGAKALTTTATGQLNPSLTTAVGNGSTTIAFEFEGLTDYTGGTQTTGLSLGPLSGAPYAAPTGKTYNGASDTDWWYTTATNTIDASRNPLNPIGAQFNGTVLSTPTRGSLTVSISLAGTPAVLTLTAAGVTAHAGTSTAPTASTGTTPGHLASEHVEANISPTVPFTTFGSMNNGFLCGNVSASTMAAVAVPTVLAQGGSFACTNKTYTTAANSLLDVIVGGCTFIFVDVINATQPDQVNPAAPVGGAGGNYSFTMTGSKVTGCKDKAGTVVADLNTCLAAAAYSSYFSFSSDRVIMK